MLKLMYALTSVIAGKRIAANMIPLEAFLANVIDDLFAIPFGDILRAPRKQAVLNRPVNDPCT